MAPEGGVLYLGSAEEKCIHITELIVITKKEREREKKKSQSCTVD